ncbi:hypothetical protein F1B92_05870 [Campylobacter sp. FMV-PI01]|uniref:Lipoprotein n=1 Tax=Campylobacter portucalensis TaxID=2608384 RepID=A0A6L5WHM8_9BACT|nr:DUF799 domain-containing protein [Campylobacter portucalensis]MSN96690.1 hypothetical protein [Campylobacter portucalensis]
MRNKIAFLSFFIIAFFTGCAKQPEIYDYSNFLNSKPRSILVVMPTNESIEVKGPAAVLSQAIMPLSEAGYYVFPVALVNDTFKNNGVYEASDIANISISKLREIFGADAALYINIEKYGSSYAILNSSTTVQANARLIDLKTSQQIWEKRVIVSENSSSGNQGILGMLITAAVSQIANTVSDAGYNLSSYANAMLFATNCNDCILFGPYSPKYGQDKQLSK